MIECLTGSKYITVTLATSPLNQFTLDALNQWFEAGLATENLINCRVILI